MATILIAEDERGVSNRARRHLEDGGQTVLQAFDGLDVCWCIRRELLARVRALLSGIATVRGIGYRFARTREN